MQVLVNINSAVLLITFTINFGLGIYVYLKNRRNEVNQIFSLFLLSTALWTLSFLVFLNSHSLEWILFWRKLTPVGSSLIASFFFYFTLIFPGRGKSFSPLNKFLILLPGFAFSALSIFSSWMIKGLVISDPFFPFLGRPLFGFAYYLFAVYFVAYFGLGVINLVLKYRRSQGREKLQVFYVLFGSGMAGVFGIAASLILPMLGWAGLFTLGPPFTLIMAGFITYAIVRYKLLNIEDFLSRGIIFLALTILAVGTFYCLISGNARFILALYIFLANAFTGLFVLSQDWRNRLNRWFCLLTFCVAFWAFCLSLFQVSGEMLWGRWTYAFASFIPAVFLSFIRVFPKVEEKREVFENSAYLAGAVLFWLAFTDLIIRRAVALPWGFTLELGPLYPLFAVYFLGVMLLAFGKLFLKYRGASGTSRIQIMYVFLGTFLTALIGISVAIVFPLLGFPRLYYLAPPSTLILIGLIAYAIVKHRLMSVEVVIQRSTVYGVVTILIMALYALAVIISETFFRKFMGYNSLVITAAAALLIAVAYQPLVKGFQNLTDRIFFRGRYDYQKTLSRISHEIASVIKLEQLTGLIASSFIETMRISEISFLLSDREREHFRSVPLTIPRYKRIEIDVGSPIISWLSEVKDILVRDEIQEGEVRDEMDRLGIHVWVPIIFKGELIGIIALGNKLSGDVFTSEDLALLTTLANQTAVALDNARLYDEVLSMKNYSEEILQSMTNGVLTTDNRGRIVTCNYMAERITGRKMSEVVGKTCEEVWGPRGAITLAIENTLKDRLCRNFETGMASPERGLVPVAFSSTILRDSQGKKIGALLSIQDLTEIKELEDKVRRADKLSALATMAAGMAHEIKNPLSSMKVLSQLLPLKYEDAEFKQKLGEILPREIDRIDRIVESLLGFARSTAPTFEEVKIEEILEETLKYFEDQAGNAGVTIKKGYAELPEIEVDRNQISQVFSNLILNAIQAMPEGGTLTVTTLPGKKIDDVLKEIKIGISDTGHGIPEDMQKKLFDPFFTTKYGGTGLGLTITHSIVDGHRGSIDVESKIGKGTTFTVTLPVSQALL